MSTFLLIVLGINHRMVYIQIRQIGDPEERWIGPIKR